MECLVTASRILAGGLLECRNRGCSGHTGRSHSVVGILVGSDVLKFLYLATVQLNVYRRKRIIIYRSEVDLIHVTGHMDNLLAVVTKLFLVDASIASGEVSRCCTGLTILHDSFIHLINLHLGVSADVRKSVSADASLYRIQCLYNERILRMVIQTSLRDAHLSGRNLKRNSGLHIHLLAHRNVSLVLRSIQNDVVYILYKLQRTLAVILGMVVPIDHHALLGRIHVVIVQILRKCDAVTAKFTHTLRISLFKERIVHKLGMEQMRRLLDIRNARLPEEVDKVNLLDTDVPKTVVLATIPEYSLGASAMLEHIPRDIGVGLLIPVLLHNHRNDSGELRCLGLVIRLSRLYITRRIRIHHITVSALDTAPQPCGCRLELLLRILLVDIPPLSQLPELFVCNNLLFESRFTGLVLLKDVGCLQYLVRTNLLRLHGLNLLCNLVFL